MRIWCAYCKSVQKLRVPRRRRRLLETLAGHVGTCAACGSPVTAIGAAMSTAQRLAPQPTQSGVPSARLAIAG